MITEELDSTDASGRCSPPHLPPASPGSSVSSTLQEEYCELLKHVVISSVTDQARGQTLTDPEPLDPLGGSQRQAEDQKKTGDLEGRSSQRTPRSNQGSSQSTPRNNQDLNINQSSRTGASDKEAGGDQVGGGAMPGLCGSAVGQMGGRLDGWLARLKADVLNEFGSLSAKMLETQKLQQEQELKELVGEKQRLQREVNRLTELVATCEQSMGRKDNLIDNLTQALATQKDKTAAAGVFFRWRLEALDRNREKFCMAIAGLHHQRQLRQRVLKAWFGLVQTRWRTRVERQCQEQATQVCRTLTHDYEDKVAELNNLVLGLQQQVSSLQREREAYADNVKKAFMRGVCALNMEAMSALTPDDPGAATAGTEDSMSFDPGLFSTLPPDPTGPAYRADSLNIVHSARNSSQTLRPVTERHPSSSLPDPSISHGLPSTVESTQTKKPSMKKDRHKLKSSASHPMQGQPLNPPMASVVVERHQPITKQTMGKATASRFIKPTDSKAPGTAGPRAPRPTSSSNQTFKPLAGQTLVSDSIKIVD